MSWRWNVKISRSQQYNETKVDGLVFRQLERTCYYRCGYKRDVEELLASENECFLNPRLVYEQHFWYLFWIQGLAFRSLVIIFLRKCRHFFFRWWLLLSKLQFSSLNPHLEWKKKSFQSRMITLWFKNDNFKAVFSWVPS